MKSNNLINVTLLLLMLAGCASHEVKDLAVKSADDYASREQVAGVTVAIEAYETKEKVEEAFTINLTEEGIIPVLLVMENQSDVSYLVLKEDIELTDIHGNVRNPVSAAVVAQKFEHNKMVYALLGFGIFSYMSAEEANKKMLSDWSEKELPEEKVLNPNRKVSGAVYFDMGKGFDALPNSVLSLQFRDLGSNEFHEIKINIP